MRSFTLCKTVQLDADALCPSALQNSASGQSETRASMTIAANKIANSNKPDNSAVFGAHDAHWDGRPPLRRIRLIEVRDVPSRIAGLLFGRYQFACDLPPDRISGMQKNAAFEVRGGKIFNGRVTFSTRTMRGTETSVVRTGRNSSAANGAMQKCTYS